MTKGLHLPSEIGKLRKVCLHRPGDELLNLPPDELERLLFDDVPFLEVAQQEHDTFAQILRDQGVEVLYLENLVAEVFDQVPGARAEFTDQYIAEAGIRGQRMPQIVREKLDSIEDNLEFVKKTMAGMTKAEIDAKLPQIIEFSECGDFIDTPVKRYSSGMFVKLAFAVAAHLDSEIMVMDEVLAVGDMKFQQKCLGKMSDVAGQEGRTVLYVSHNMSTIRQLCTRCVVLDQGRVIFDGDVEQAIAVYMETTDVNVVHYDLMDVSRMNASAGKRMRLETLDFVGKESSVFADTEKIRVRITWRVSEPFAGVHLKLNLHFRDSTPVGITHPVNLGAAVPGKLYTTEFEFDPSLLGEGQYFFYVDVFDGVLTQAVCLDKPVTEFAFEVTSGDLTMPEWAPGWGRIHFPPVKVLENGYDG